MHGAITHAARNKIDKVPSVFVDDSLLYYHE